MRVGEGGGDDALELQGKLIGCLVVVVVKFVADAVEKVVSGIEFVAGGGGDDAVFHESGKVGAALFDSGDPEDVVEVAESAAAFLDVRFLEEDGMRIFLVSSAEVLAADVEERGLSFADAVLFKAFLKLGEQLGVPGDETGVHEGGFVFLVCLGLLDAFWD